MSESQLSEPKVSERFCSLDSDITLRSCDGVLFKFYRKKLESYSEAFAGAEGFATSLTEDIVDLSETADVLDLLFQFMLLAPQPDLTSLDFSLLHAFAEAVEKYAVFAAMPPCETSMKAAIPLHSLEVLEYAAKHKKVDIMDTAARTTIGLQIGTVQGSLSAGVFTAWLRYFQCWLDALGYAHNNVSPRLHMDFDDCCCEEWHEAVAVIGHRLGARPESLKDLDDTFQTESETCHTNDSVKSWKSAVALKVNGIPKFSTLL